MDVPLVGESTEACSPTRFRTAALIVASLLPGALESIGGLDEVCATYTQAWLARDRGCTTYPQSRRSGTGLLLNAGAGTSGTRFVDCVIRRSTNLHTEHNPAFNNSDVKHITARVDSFDFLSDSPIPYMLGSVLASHLGNRSSGVLLSVRDPWAWMASRNKHKSSHCCSVPTAPCGTPVPLSSLNDVSLARHFFAYQAWAACISTSPQLGYDADHLFAFNIFDSTPANLTSRFFAALQRMPGVSPRLRDKGTFLKAWAACNTH